MYFAHGDEIHAEPVVTTSPNMLPLIILVALLVIGATVVAYAVMRNHKPKTTSEPKTTE